MTLSRFITQAEAVALVESGLVEELRSRASEARKRELQELTEAGYQKAMRDYGVSREQVNPMWVQNEYVNYHTHGGFPRGDKGIEMARSIEAYARDELRVNYAESDTQRGILIPLTQLYMETSQYCSEDVWNPRVQGERVGPGYVAFGSTAFLDRENIAKTAECFCLWALASVKEVEFSPSRSSKKWNNGDQKPNPHF